MNQNNSELDDTLVDTTPDLGSDDVPFPQFPNDLVTVTLTVTLDTCSIEVARIGQSLPYAQRTLKKTTTLFGAAGNLDNEFQEFRCTCPTMDAARQACRDLERLARRRFEASVMVDEEEFEILAVACI